MSTALTFHADVHRALRTALQAALSTPVTLIDPVGQVAMEARDFAPTVGVPYARESCKWGKERLKTIPAPGGYTRIDGLYLIDLFFPDNQGDAQIDQCVGQVRTTFVAGEVVSYNGALVHLLGVSRSGAMRQESGFIMTPLGIPFYAYDQNPS